MVTQRSQKPALKRLARHCQLDLWYHPPDFQEQNSILMFQYQLQHSHGLPRRKQMRCQESSLANGNFNHKFNTQLNIRTSGWEEEGEEAEEQEEIRRGLR
ncbi:hypothetical protein C4D60_Mb06t03690 [Musa balbisiana]|uniref:Uncharacterized protein n=1 Tax=Musa balbisiana TaxID=52838 RepID=A0A4S8IKD9_MUSBA|nr:hypothetical protein C4D60_Mb06t03690 [Musa balbisiana]